MNTWNLYRISIPSGEYYYGSTSMRVSQRRSVHTANLREGKHKSKPLQEWFNSGGKQSEIVWDELETGDEYKIRCEEHYIIKKHIDDSKCLNIRIPFPPHLIKISMEQGPVAAQKQYTKENTPSWNMTPRGKMNSGLISARNYIKMYTKQNRPDMVKRWEIILKQRLDERNSYLRDR